MVPTPLHPLLHIFKLHTYQLWKKNFPVCLPGRLFSNWTTRRGQQVQTWLDERAYADIGEKHQHDQKKCGGISPGELRRIGTYNPIRVDISTTRHLGHKGRVRGIRENDLGNLLPRLFFRKTKILSPIVGAQSTMPVKKSGPKPLNPVTSA